MRIRSSLSFGVAYALVLFLAGLVQAQIAPPEPPLTDFVRRIHQDARGDLWLGTNGDGVIRRRGNELTTFTPRNGFGGVAVRGIVEDAEGNVWFGTDGGLSMYDGTSFTNYTSKDGLVGDDVWALTIDADGELWIGTLKGVSRFNGARFTPFNLPKFTPDHTRGVTSNAVVHCIMQDSKGDMWFGSSNGAWRHDGETLTNISTFDGLCGDSVNSIIEDAQGRYWFATHYNGVCRMDGDQFIHFGADDGVQGTEAWSLTMDRAGNIWFPTEGFGVYRYDGDSFTNIGEDAGLPSTAIQCIYEDDRGTIWLGGWMGLFRIDGNSVNPVTASGPWSGPDAATPTSVHGRLVLPPGPGVRGLQVIGTVRLDNDEVIDEWLILNENGGFTHDFAGELIGLRVASGIEAVIIRYDEDDLPVPDRAGQIDLGDIEVRDKLVERTLRLQMNEDPARGSVRIGMWFGEPPEGVSLGSRQFPVVETGSTTRWLLPLDATDIHFLIEHPRNPGATAESWRSGSQQRFGPYSSTTFPEALNIRPK